jgi:hypothetical protein
VAVADSLTVARGGTATVLSGGATSVLANDTDAGGDPLGAVLVSGPVNGTRTLNANGSFSYTHNGSATTSDSFTYKANDGTADGNVTTVTIAVLPQPGIAPMPGRILASAATGGRTAPCRCGPGPCRPVHPSTLEETDP